MDKIIDASEFPAPLKGELSALLSSLKAKYGAQNVRMGMHIKNMATMVGMIATPNLDAASRQTAAAHAKDLMLGMLKDLGGALNADPAAAFSVANALSEFTNHAETEMLGEQPMPADVADEAAAILTRAAGGKDTPTVH